MDSLPNEAGNTPDHVCAECGSRNYPTSYVASSEIKKKMDADGVCWDCGYWRVAISKGYDTVIAGRIYSLGDTKKPPNSPHSGMAGRRFDIEYFDGRVVTTHDLWAGGDVPERYRQQIPDTARFLGGAGFVKVGDGGAWNASAPRARATRSPQ